MNSFHPRLAHSSRRGRAVPVWIACALAAAVIAAAVLFLARPPAAERAYRKGNELLVAGENALAAEQFRLVIELDPRIDGAWHGLLEAEPSLRVCRRLAENRPELFDLRQPVNDDTLLVRSRDWSEGRWRRSLRIYEKAVLAAPAGGADAAILRLDVLGRRDVAEAWDEARKLRQELSAALKTPLPPSRLKPFDVYDLAGAQKVIAGAAAGFKSPKAWLGQMTRIEAAIVKHKSGVARLEQALELDPSFLPAHLTLACVEIARGRPAAAEKRCRKLLEAPAGRPGGPAEPRIRFCLARALELAGRANDAAEQVEQILRVTPGDPETLLRLGTLYLRLGRVDEADEIAKKAMGGQTFSPKTNYIRGVASLQRGDNDGAVAQLSAALSGRPDDLGIQYSLARAHEAAGRHVTAHRAFAAVAARARRPGWPFAAASAAALAAGDGSAAGISAENALADEASLAAEPKLRAHAVRFKVAAAAMRGGQHLAGMLPEQPGRPGEDDELVNYLVAGSLAGQVYAAPDAAAALDEEHLALFKTASDPSAKYCLAFLLAAGGRTRDARDVLEKLNKDHPKYLIAALHLARLYLIEGKTELAARTLRRTGQAATSRAVARELALIDSLQNVSSLDGSHEADSAAAGSGPAGPHLAFFAAAMQADHRAYAQRVVLLDPVGEVARDILRLTYSHVRRHGLKGVAMAAEADKAADLAIHHATAVYQAGSKRLYELAVGSFWDDLPPQL
ncbi:MAG: tetratricopeptide repeat protein [Planctomycetota bacterium]